jgi:RHS repeat-associated protein
VVSAIDMASNIQYVTGASYGPDGAITGFISESSASFAGITNSFSYNKRLQPVTMSATSPAQTVFSIGYDFRLGNGNNGNVWNLYNYKDRNRDQTFTYDALNRLTSAQNAGTDCNQKVLENKTEYWGNSYSYDAWGNLLNKTVTKCGAENLAVTADVHNWIHATGTPDYQYDAAGNMTFNATAPTQTYTYDQENRLTGAAGYTYTYDADGNRVKKANGSTGTLYWYMTPGIVAESDLNGNLTSEYVFFGGERVARKDFAGGTTSVAYYFSDHLKTASVITDSAGVIKSESDFYPWGAELQFVANDSNHYKFTGKERDTETNLDYFGARYYSNGLGRWVSADWSATPVAVPYADFGDPQSLNLYGYVRGLPTTRADADGHCDWCKQAWDFSTGVVQGYVSSASWGTVGAPSSSDSTASLLGQMLGTAFEGTQGTITRTAGAAAVGTGLVAEGPSGGTSTAVVVVGGAAVVAGAYQETAAVHNAGAIINAMSAKSGGGSNTSPTTETGSYTNTHESGKTYDGKGDRTRSQDSGKRIEKQTGDKHSATEFNPATNDREAFKDESRKLDSHGGPRSSANHNKIESPGKKYREQDGSK